MSEAPRFFVGPEDTEINSGNYRHFFHHADEDEEEEDESVSCLVREDQYSIDFLLITVKVNYYCLNCEAIFAHSNLLEVFCTKTACFITTLLNLCCIKKSNQESEF